MITYCILAGISLSLCTPSSPLPTGRRGAPDQQRLCSSVDAVSMAASDVIRTTSRLVDVFCSREDVQEMVLLEGSCRRYIDDVIRLASFRIRAPVVSEVNPEVLRAAARDGMAETLHDLLQRNSDLSKATGAIMDVHNSCECPLTPSDHVTCPHRPRISPLVGRYCNQSTGLLHGARNKIHSLVHHTNLLVYNMDLGRPTGSPAPSHQPLPIGDTVLRLTYTLVTLTNVRRQAELTLSTLCHACHHRPRPCAYLLQHPAGGE